MVMPIVIIDGALNCILIPLVLTNAGCTDCVQEVLCVL